MAALRTYPRGLLIEVLVAQELGLVVKRLGSADQVVYPRFGLPLVEALRPCSVSKRARPAGAPRPGKGVEVG